MSSETVEEKLSLKLFGASRKRLSRVQTSSLVNFSSQIARVGELL